MYKEENLYYQNKYRVPSARRPGWDYSSDGYYYITICTDQRRLMFGDVQDGEMKLNKIGQTANEYWQEISKHFQFVYRDVYQIMPNHIHGILLIDKTGELSGDGDVETRHGPQNVETRHGPQNVETRHGASLRQYGKNVISLRHGASLQDEHKSNFGPLKANSLPAIVNQFKGAVTRWCNKNNIGFAWQERYYDRIIRDDGELNRIRQYIMDNPVKWCLDRNNPYQRIN